MRANPTELPSIPPIGNGVDPSTRKTIEALTEVVEVLTKRRGDPYDRAVTVRDLVNAGVVKQLVDGIPQDTVLDDAPDFLFTPDGIATPGRPTNVDISSTFNNAFITFDEPRYAGHAYTEIWRSNDSTLANATLRGTTPSTLFVDPIQSGQTYWYWVRFVNKGNPPVFGPWADVAGHEITTRLSPTDVADILAGELDESHLVASLNSRINIIDVLGGPDGNGLVNWADLVDAAIYDPGTGINAVLGAHTTSIDTTIPNQITAQADRVTALFAGDLVDPADGVTPNVLAADINSIDLAINDSATGLTVSAQRIDALFANSPTDPLGGGPSALVSAISTAETNATNVANGSAPGSMNDLLAGPWANASTLSQWVAAVGDNTGSLETLAEVVGTNDGEGMRAQYHVKTDVNGNVGGYGLWNEAGIIEFVVTANRFAVAEPTVDAGASKYPFVIGTVNGATAISMNAATFIQDATIQTAAIADLAVDSAKIANLAVQTAKITDGAITNAKIALLAVDTAQIALAAVDTLQLKGQAVTIPSGSYTEAATASFTTTETTIQDVTFTSTGADVMINASAWFDHSAITGGSVEVYIYRGTTKLCTVPVNTVVVDIAPNQSGMLVSITINDEAASAGSVTYYLKAKRTSGVGTFTASNRSLNCIELKR